LKPTLPLLGRPVDCDGDKAVETGPDRRLDEVERRVSWDDEREPQFHVPQEERRRGHGSCCAAGAGVPTPGVGAARCSAVRHSAERAGIR
jgi:hypothetical protein